MLIETSDKLTSIQRKKKVAEKDEDTKKVGIKREEVIDALRSLEGVKRKLKRALDSA
jgi:hypothetical protein